MNGQRVPIIPLMKQMLHNGNPIEHEQEGHEEEGHTE